MDYSMTTNLNAMMANYYLNQTNQQIALATQRLSTGLAINQPSDNPSGFVVATGYQSQIDSMNQAISNIQDGNNEMKTASSAVSQITSLIDTIQTSAQDALGNPGNAAADQSAITDAINSINNIANNTIYNGHNLLNGTAGVSAAVTNSSVLSNASVGSTFDGQNTPAGTMSVNVTQVAAAATLVSTATYTLGTNATFATSGSMTINGQTINVTAGQSVQTLLNSINSLSSTTGVTANFSGTTNGKIVLSQTTTGSQYTINESDTGVFTSGGGSSNVVGQNAIATVSIQQAGGGSVSETMTGGQSAGASGLQLSDNNGNSVTLTPSAGGTASNYTNVASVTNNASTFQIGANPGQTASFAFQNMQANNLGTSAIAGQSLQSINVTSSSGASNAIQIAAAALTQVTSYAAQIGSFQNNVLTATQTYLTNSVANLQASYASIMDVNVAQESTNLSNLQNQQQDGVAALYAANNQMSIYSKLLP